jgi:CubicO group peptidase (beta-lactamase class C family)
VRATGTSKGVLQMPDLKSYFRGGLATLVSAVALGCSPTSPTPLPPSVLIVLPEDGAVVSVGDTVRVRAEVTAGDGSVLRVEFWADEQLVGTDDTSPYEADWNTAGTRVRFSEITATAYDDLGSADTASVRVETLWVYRPPEQVDDGWETESLAEVGMDEGLLIDLMNLIRGTPHHRIHSIVIAVGGGLVLEEYFDGLTHPTIGEEPISYDRDTWHVLSSTTKSFTSALLGIAIDRGYIPGVDQPISEFFPEIPELSQPPKSDLTLEHMITMSSGLQWDQTTYPILDSRNDIARMQRASDPWQFYLSRPLVSTPGSRFLYSEGSINVVGEVIKRASGLRLDHFAEQYLFEPLGIEQHWWAVIRSDIGFVWASGDLRLRPRDMARFGQLYLQGGEWHGQQIVPQQWVEASVVARFTFPETPYGDVGYGYAWWVPNQAHGPGAFAARGWGNQEIIVIPEHEMVVAVTGGAYYEYPFMFPHEIIEEWVLPSFGGTP